MSVREIPKSYEYTCDVCSKQHVQPNANGQYTNGTPPYWSRLKIARNAYDYQGAAVADGSIERLLCDVCSKIVYDAVNDAVVSAVKAKPEPGKV